MLDFAHRQQRRSTPPAFAGAAAFVAAGFSLCAGDQWLSPARWFGPEGQLFVWQIRLPRTLAVIWSVPRWRSQAPLCRRCLKTLAEPGLLGVSNGAGVGLIAAVMLGGGALSGVSLSAILGALLITLILLRFARRHLSISRLLLAGVALGIICSALMTGRSTSPPRSICVS